MDDIEYRILGPVEVVRAGTTVPIGAPRQRAVLVTLLLEANRVVSVDRLIQQLWGEWSPPRARTTIQSLVLRLRRALHPDRGVSHGRVLLTRNPGYLLRVGAEQLDLHRFDALVRQGRAALAVGRPAMAADLLHRGLELWRGEPFDDAAGAGLHAVDAPRLSERRVQAIEERVEADLALQRTAELITELPRLIAEHPLRERFYGQLMLALYRTGRQAEALELYHTLRRQLVTELAIEPSVGLQRLYRQMLTHAAVLDVPPTWGLDSRPSPERATSGTD